MNSAFLCLILLVSISFSAQASNLSTESAEKLSLLRTSIRTWAPVCPDGTFTNDGRVNPDGSVRDCPMGDMTIFAGLLCLSGEKDRCENVKRAQDQTGRWWRSPGLINVPKEGPTFSRDQSKGVLAYLIATHDTASAEKWMDFIESNDNRLCPTASSGNDACETRATFWAETRNVWKYLGLPLRKKMSRSKSWIDAIYSPFETELQPTSFPMHLTASGVYLAQEMQKRGYDGDNQSTHRKEAKIMTRREPQNPFYHYLASGSDEEGAQLIFNVCPMQRPQVTGTIPDWIWQRGYDWKEDGESVRRWTFPSGWDCIFAINLYLGAEKIAQTAP